MLGMYEEAEATVYLTTGDHFLPFRSSQAYQPSLTTNNDEELTFHLSLKPLPCSAISGYEATYSDVCSQSEIVQSPEITVYSLMGAYFRLTVPRSLTIQGIRFDALSSETAMTSQCINERKIQCVYDPSLTSLDPTLCPCSYTNYTYQDCATSRPLYFISAPAFNATLLEKPRLINISHSQFQNFFSGYSALIGFQNSAGIELKISNSLFLNISLCNGALSNTYTPFYSSQGSAVQQALTQLIPAKPSSHSYTCFLCSSITISNSTFTFFNDLNLPTGQVYHKSLHFQNGRKIESRGFVIDLRAFQGSISISSSHFSQAKLKFSAFNLAGSLTPQDETVSLYSLSLTKSGLLNQNPIILSQISHSAVEILDSTFADSSGTKGIISLSFKNNDLLTALIAGNHFSRCSGLYKSSALHLSSLIESYTLDDSYAHRCSNFYVYNNTFYRNTMLPQDNSLISLSCVLTSSYFQQASQQPIYWVSSPFYDRYTNLDEYFYYNGATQVVNMRYAVLESNKFERNYRYGGGSLIQLNGIPFIVLRDNEFVQNGDFFIAYTFYNNSLDAFYAANSGLHSEYTSSALPQIQYSSSQLVLVTYGNLELEIDGLSAQQNYYVEAYNGESAEILLHLSEFELSRLEIKRLAVDGTGQYSHTLVQNIEFGYSNRSERADLTYVNSSHIYQTQMTPLVHLTTASAPYSIILEELSLTNLHVSSAVAQTVLTLSGSHIFDLEVYTLSLSSSILEAPLFEIGSGYVLFQFLSIHSFDSQHHALFYSHTSEYVDFYDAYITSASLLNFYSVANSAISLSTAYLSFDSLSVKQSIFRLTQISSASMDVLEISNTAVTLSTDATVSSLFIISSGLARFSDLVIYSSAARDHCQIITTADSISLSNVLIERVDTSTIGECSVAPIQLKGGQSTFNNVRVLNFNNLGALRNGGALSLTNTRLTDSSSIYRSNSAAEGGALYLDQNAQYIAQECTYEQNQAQAGGVFSLKKNAKLAVSSSTLQFNHASQKGGLLWMIASSQVNFTLATISHNSAFREALISAELTDLVSITSHQNVVSSLSHSVLSNNTASRELVMSLYSSSFSLHNITYVDNQGSTMFAGIRMEGSNLTITSSSFSYSESLFLNCFMSRSVIQSGFILSQYSSRLLIYNSSFIRGCAKTAGAIMVYGSTELRIENCSFSHNKAADNGGALYLSLHKEVKVLNSTFYNNTASKGADLYVQEPFLNDTVAIENSTFSGDKEYQSLWVGEAPLTIEGANFYGSSLLSDPQTSLIQCANCLDFELTGSTFSQFASTLSLLQISTTSAMNIQSNYFMHIQAHQNGGVIHVTKSNSLSILQNEFRNISLQSGSGGAISLSGSETQGVLISDNKFEECVAEMGGALAFDFHKPELVQNQFVLNSALIYGADVASYPVSLGLVTGDGRLLQGSTAQLEGVQSGGVLSSFQLGLVDNDGQLYTPDSSSVVTVLVHSSQSLAYAANIQGTTEFRASEGVFNITGVAVVSEPGTEVSVKFKTNAIDSSLPLVDTSAELWDSFELQIKLRACEVGEAFLQNGECQQCAQGTYLLQAPVSPTNCEQCPANAVCYGGNLVTPAPGYWRQSGESLLFFQCFNPGACVGSTLQNYSAAGHCHSNYQGILCAECKANFSRNSFFECEICPEVWKNLLLVLLILFVAAFFLIFLIKITLASSTSPRSVLSVFIKIMFSHIQMLTLVGALQLNWPSEVSSFIQKSGVVTEAIKSIFSLDCLIGNFVAIKRFYIYLITFFTLPFLLIGASYLFWFCLSKATPQIKANKSTATILTILFLIHPVITSIIFQAFYCRNINHKYRLVEELSEVCWSTGHLQYAVPFGGLGLLIWVIGVPLGSFLLLQESKEALSTLKMRQKYGFLYNGYKRNAYFWEPVVMLRKAAVSFIAVFLRTYGVVIQALCTELLLIVSIFMTLKVKPYERKILNSMEIISLACLSVTVYCGIYYLSAKLESDQSFIYGRDYVLTDEGKWFFFAVILISNVIFLLAWLRNLADAFVETLVEK